MGYYIEMTDSNFVIKRENFAKALEKLKSVFVPENMTCKDRISGKEYPHFRWVDSKTVLDSATLGDALREIRYYPSYNSTGDVIDVEFTGSKYGDEEVFFNAIASYVESGSYLSFEGEDSKTWNWVFNNGAVGMH